MSWVTNVILLFGLRENYAETLTEHDQDNPDIPVDEGEDFADEQDGDRYYYATPPVIHKINRWLKEHDQVTVIDLTIGVVGPERKAMEANVWGAAFNFLEADEFIQFVVGLNWREPDNVQLLIQDQEESKFTLHTILSK